MDIADRILQNNVISGIIFFTLRSITLSLVFVTKFSLSILAFASITLPKWTYKVLSYSLTIQFSFKSLLFLSFVSFCVAILIIRYRYLNKYSRLPHEAPIREAKLGPDASVQISEPKIGFQNYLDEFLSAISIFGYLEKPVFVELARHIQTRRVAEGDTIDLDEESSFILVVDGCFQVYTSTEPSNDDGSRDPSSLHSEYRLLTEVSNGAPLSSFFTVLELFTEIVPEVSIVPSTTQSTGTPTDLVDNPFPVNSIGSKKSQSKDQFKLKEKSSIVAKAKCDTTIAVIPGSAFHHLVRKFPNSSAQIVQVILTRFQRVTFSTGFEYLGLSDAIFSIEKNFNAITSYELPNYIRGDIIETFKNEAKSENRNKKVKGGIILSQKRGPAHRTGNFNRNFEVFGSEVDRSTANAGDLLSSTNPHATLSQSVAPNMKRSPLRRAYSREVGDYDVYSSFRNGLLHCILNSLGIANYGIKSQSTASSVDDELSSGEQESIKSTDQSEKSSKVDFLGQLAMMSATGVNEDTKSPAISNQKQSTILEFAKEIEIIFYKKKTTVVQQGDHADGVFYIIDGFLDATCPSKVATYGTQEQLEQHSFMMKPGGLVNYQACVSNYRSFVNVTARTDVLVGYLPRTALERIIEQEPLISLIIAKRLISLVPPLLLKLDFAVGWIHLNPDQVLFHKGDPSDSIYVVQNGRLRSIDDSNTKANSDYFDEYGNGDSAGELEMLINAPRSSTLFAIRDSELAKIPQTLFNALSLSHPAVGLQLSKIIANRMHIMLNNKFIYGGIHQTKREKHSIRTLAVVPSSSTAFLILFSQKLTFSLSVLGISVKILRQSSVLEHLGKYAFSRMGRFKLASYLSDLEDKYDILIYVADTNVGTTWFQTCVRQADCIYILAEADRNPRIGEFESYLIAMKCTARKELVLIHPERFCPSGLTRTWLKERPWVYAHHHLQLRAGRDNEMVDHNDGKEFLNIIRSKVMNLHYGFRKYIDWKHLHPVYQTNRAQESDFARLARRICGKAIGLVLGGGGARGISQIGALYALEEAGIPFDIIGGTSIGAFNGGLYAREADLVPMFGRAKKFCGRMANLWRFVLDLTYPQAAYTTGHEFNRGIWKTFGESHIEDFWLPFYVNTTNITHSRMDVHSSGYAWRYIRASMSLAGLVPPMLSDNGDMLLDGGYMDNLTVTHMQSLGANTIFAIDVGSEDSRLAMDYGDTVSGAWALFARWIPFISKKAYPSLADIQSRLTYVTSVAIGEKVKSTPGCFYMRPPVTDFKTLEFGSFEKIYGVGYEYGKAFIDKLKTEGKLDGILGTSTQYQKYPKYLSPRRNSL
ncbi:lysophospholipase [Schizosaccharomyces cryophilus OY26]|uniref:Lysophospholipase NTE1 n=1 Tax=Schizosaccharomyces cryophilus (strain OY26 / ATCC MYA-4695 / CBS 11777 / NBRC 106824 / NRRL Y48691) TaxID=653667 RepID=S9VX67_SCHCR|nr:lysophospholipase [Schizosaccharomyces cryophilus OY26]EPY50585.1 lysophospholipase [Schizosaccharomyces cryophilus OY26]